MIEPIKMRDISDDTPAMTWVERDQRSDEIHHAFCNGLPIPAPAEGWTDEQLAYLENLTGGLIVHLASEDDRIKQESAEGS